MSTPPPMPPQPPAYYPQPGQQPPHKSNTLAIVIGVVVVCVVVFGACGISILLPSLSRAREMANRVKCAANLKQMGAALMLYANENKGAYPDSIAGMIEEEVSPGVFACPSSNDTPAARGANAKATAANVQSGGHLSYTYLGKGKTSALPANYIVVYEPLSNHQNKGMNVLFGDGSVQFLNAQAGAALMGELNAGHNPPRLKFSAN